MTLHRAGALRPIDGSTGRRAHGRQIVSLEGVAGWTIKLAGGKAQLLLSAVGDRPVTFLAGLMLGLVGGGHCAVMRAAGARVRPPERSPAGRLRHTLTYHAGRLACCWPD
jgi:hypothetical protein